MNRLCTICARAGSKGVKNKNIKTLCGKPLISYSIEQAIESNLFNHVVVSTDSDEIIDISTKLGADVFFKRSPDLSSDTAGKIAVIRDAFQKSELHFNTQFDTLFDLDATSPLRTNEDLLASLKIFEEEGNDNLITAMPSRRSPYFNLIERDSLGKVTLSKTHSSKINRRQDSPATYDLNASIYIWKREAILKNDSIFGENTGLYVMPEERSIDIDTELDFKFVEFLMRQNTKT